MVGILTELSQKTLPQQKIRMVTQGVALGYH